MGPNSLLCGGMNSLRWVHGGTIIGKLITVQHLEKIQLLGNIVTYFEADYRLTDQILLPPSNHITLSVGTDATRPSGG